MSTSVPDYRRYEELRLSLKDVQRGFERTALSWPNLTHRLFSAPDKSLSIEAWNAFRDANRTSDGGWDFWEPFPDGGYCSQFLGEEKWLQVFSKLAESGMLVLKEIAALGQVKGATPDGMRAILPGVGGHSDWVSLVYDGHRTEEICHDYLELPTLRTTTFHRWNQYGWSGSALLVLQ